MLLWQTASLAFFAYLVLVVAWQTRSTFGSGSDAGRSQRPERRRLLAGVATGVVMVVLSTLPGQSWLLTDWIWPPLVLLTAYWTSGLLFVAPVPSQEHALALLDESFAIQRIARHTPRVLVEALECAYMAVYLLVPIALLLRYAVGQDPDPARFWAVILITDFICFGVLPWVQTRPPRALERSEPWSSSIRRWNLQLLGSTSIQVNTFPSGHAAEALAAALLVLDAPPSVVAPMVVAAVAVSAGAVLGRYHYLGDALAGWLVTLAVFGLLA